MESIRYANICEADLSYLFGKAEKEIQRWVTDGLPQNSDGSFTLSRAIRWREKCNADREREKVLLSKIAQRDLAEIVGRSRIQIFNWTKKAGLPRNPDGTYDLAKVVRWFCSYFDRIHKARYRKAASQIQKLYDIFKEK